MMRFLVWNVRGVASSGSFQRLHVLLRRHRPLILCLLEPFCDNVRLDSFRLRFDFDSAFAGVDDKLWLFWNFDLTLSFESDSDQSVSVSCIHATIPTAFWVSFVYAKTKERLRVSLWAELCSVLDKVPSGVPWSVVGDFNCLLNVDEKKGGLPYPHRKTTNFRECVSTCDLIDSTVYGSSFTWWNGRRKETAIWMRLDRFLYTSVWNHCLGHLFSICHRPRLTTLLYLLLLRSYLLNMFLTILSFLLCPLTVSSLPFLKCSGELSRSSRMYSALFFSYAL